MLLSAHVNLAWELLRQYFGQVKFLLQNDPCMSQTEGVAGLKDLPCKRNSPPPENHSYDFYV